MSQWITTPATIIATAPEWNCAIRLPVIAWVRWHDGTMRPYPHIKMPDTFRYAIVTPDGFCGDTGLPYASASAWLASVTPEGQEPVRLRDSEITDKGADHAS